jgi:UDP-N-acetylmuramoylalanine--D-glutamate ligase
MHDAVRRTTELCSPGDAVVLSPACSSYDMFQNFGHRGRVLRDAVAQVTATPPSLAADRDRPGTGGAGG